jgi:hypothetical protein
MKRKRTHFSFLLNKVATGIKYSLRLKLHDVVRAIKLTAVIRSRAVKGRYCPPGRKLFQKITPGSIDLAISATSTKIAIFERAGAARSLSSLADLGQELDSRSRKRVLSPPRVTADSMVSLMTSLDGRVFFRDTSCGHTCIIRVDDKLFARPSAGLWVLLGLACIRYPGRWWSTTALSIGCHSL